ncbi:hypothetical protein [Streptomyces sp. NPDC018833]|uniref:hypothetical protein n=1 Tax=Streptomyces sp. NPDC018833 TaxID=3365053 RepID=UPI0037AEC99C
MRRLEAARYLTDFDSSVNMVRAVASFLRGEDHRGLSVGPGSPRLAALLSAPPRPVRRRMFELMGFSQGIPLDRVRHVTSEDLDTWVVRQYGQGPYPAVVIGAPSGGAVHLAAALRAPFLPQTLLVAVRDVATYPDDPVGAMEAVAPSARMVAARNPDLAVHHMHDPAQDRPMLQKMAYLRLKKQRLGRVYERFLEQCLAPGATVIQLECTRDWRSRKVGERTFLQFGCLGGVTEEEYHSSGERISRYLRAEGSPYDHWEPPEPDARRPEAEWGFDPALAPDIRRTADVNGYVLRRLVVHEPQDLSPFVADLHRWWYRRRGLTGDRLLVESYVQWDPLWTLRLGAVPFWMRFNMQPSYDALKTYLDASEPYGAIHLNLFSQGLRSPGVVPLERFADLVTSRATRTGQIIGVDERAYPSDTGSSLRYQPAFESLPPRHPLPPPLTVEAVDTFLGQATRSYEVEWA